MHRNICEMCVNKLGLIYILLYCACSVGEDASWKSACTGLAQSSSHRCARDCSVDRKRTLSSVTVRRRGSSFSRGRNCKTKNNLTSTNSSPCAFVFWENRPLSWVEQLRYTHLYNFFKAIKLLHRGKDNFYQIVHYGIKNTKLTHILNIKYKVLS